MTYHGSENDVAAAGEGVMVLGSGPYCIGSSVEFDWCAVSCVRSLRASGLRAIVVNYNPETVSTDYDECDRLYFEELSLERVLDIYEREAAAGVIVSVGGQIPQNLAIPLHRQGVRILGTSPVDIDRAEDRGKFSKLLDSIGVDQPPWCVRQWEGNRVQRFICRHLRHLASSLTRCVTCRQTLASLEGAKAFATTVRGLLGLDLNPPSLPAAPASASPQVGYPVLVRPSYVLSGAAMSVAATEAQLVASLSGAALVSQARRGVWRWEGRMTRHLSSFLSPPRRSTPSSSPSSSSTPRRSSSTQSQRLAKGGGGRARRSRNGKLGGEKQRHGLQRTPLLSPNAASCSQDGVILNYAISEHVENAGVHSGDATLVLPAQKLYVETIRQARERRWRALGSPRPCHVFSPPSSSSATSCRSRRSRLRLQGR